jgi:LysR family positive regulator for ilvC
MDIPSLGLYIRLSRNFHFGKTSEEMHTSPSAVRRAFHLLEGQLGHSFFVRDNKNAQLTGQEQILLE